MAIRQKRKEIPDAVAQGKAEQTEPQKVQDIVQPVEEKSTLTKVAEFGLTPAAFMAKNLAPKINTINKLFGGKDIYDESLSVNQIAEMTAKYSPSGVPVGKGLGLTTVALEAYLGGKLAARALPSFTPKIASGVRLRGASSKIFPKISNAAVRREATRAGLTRAGTAQVKRQLGKMRVQEVANALRNNQGTLLSRYVKGSLKPQRIGGAALLGWLGADTLAQSASMQAAASEKNVIFGQSTKSEALSDLERNQATNNTAKAALLAAAAISPAAIPLLIFGYQSTVAADGQIDKSRRVIEGL